jgi:hypothetical protein
MANPNGWRGTRFAPNRAIDLNSVRRAISSLGNCSRTLQTDGLPLKISEITNRTKNKTNNTWAIQAEVPAIPLNPNIAAMIATTKKTIA